MRVRLFFKRCGRPLLMLLALPPVEQTLASIFWGAAHGAAWYTVMTRPLHVQDYNLAVVTAVLVGSTAYFERQHASQTARMVHDHIEELAHKLSERRDHESEDREHLRVVMLGLEHLVLSHHEDDDRGEEYRDEVQSRAAHALAATEREGDRNNASR